MTEETTRHIVDEELGDPASYLTVRPGARVYDLFGWAAGRVVETRIATTRDELFDGLVVDFRGRRLFVDAPEVRSIHEGVVLLRLTVADMGRVVRDRSARPLWPGGPCQVPARAATEEAVSDDAVALMASVSRMYVADRLPLTAMERELERVLRARTCGDLDAIATQVMSRASARPRTTAATASG
jgi:hypothetical protein